MKIVKSHVMKPKKIGHKRNINKKIKRKGEKHRFFKMSSDIFITLDKTKEDIEKKGILKRIFRDGIKIAFVPIIAIMSLFTQHTFDNSGLDVAKSNNDIIVIGLIIIIIGLITERIYFQKKKKG